MARPRKPNHIKKAQGTYNSTKEESRSVTIKGVDSVKPDRTDLTESEKRYFNIIVEQLRRMGILRPEFVGDITRAAIHWDLYLQFRDAIKSDGVVQRSSGWAQTHSAFSGLEKCHKMIVSFEDKYGLNLTSYERLGIKEEDGDPLEGLKK